MWSDTLLWFCFAFISSMIVMSSVFSCAYWLCVYLLRKWKWSHDQLFATPWTAACQAPLSMGFSRQQYWSGLPFPSPGDLPNPGIKPGLPHCRQMLLSSEPPGKKSLLKPCAHFDCIFFSLLLNFKHTLSILDINSLSDILFVDSVLWSTQLFHIDEMQIAYFFFYCLCFSHHVQKALLNPRQ